MPLESQEWWVEWRGGGDTCVLQVHSGTFCIITFNSCQTWTIPLPLGSTQRWHCRESRFIYTSWSYVGHVTCTRGIVAASSTPRGAVWSVVGHAFACPFTCSICPCTTCVHISVAFQGGWCCLSCCRTRWSHCSQNAQWRQGEPQRQGMQQAWSRGYQMVDHGATCRLGSADMGPLNVELLHKLYMCCVCHVLCCHSIV